MNKSAFSLSLLFLLEITFTGSVHAARTKHRPWLAGKRKEAVVEKDVLGVVRRSAPVVVRTRRVQSSPAPTHTGVLIAERAKQYKGSRYRFGGTTKSGFDCSGLVSRVWEDLKLKKVPRVSSDLYQSGKPVHLADLQEGDLVFFKNTYKRGISHVGVYTGKNKFVHAPGTSQRVSITRLSDPYYQIHYAGARRLY